MEKVKAPIYDYTIGELSNLFAVTPIIFRQWLVKHLPDLAPLDKFKSNQVQQIFTTFEIPFVSETTLKLLTLRKRTK